MNFDEYQAHIQMMNEFLNRLREEKVTLKKTKAFRRLVKALQNAGKKCKAFSFSVDEGLHLEVKMKREERDNLKEKSKNGT